jgi:hypothetical protein
MARRAKRDTLRRYVGVRFVCVRSDQPVDVYQYQFRRRLSGKRMNGLGHLSGSPNAPAARSSVTLKNTDASECVVAISITSITKHALRMLSLR